MVPAMMRGLRRRNSAKVSQQDRVCPKGCQGSQFTGQTFTGALAGNGIAISMDGKVAWRDNVFVERLWRSVKYEEVYLRAYDSVAKPVLRSAGILTSTMAAGPTRALMATHPIKRTSTLCPSAWRPNPGRDST